MESVKGVLIAVITAIILSVGGSFVTFKIFQATQELKNAEYEKQIEVLETKVKALTESQLDKKDFNKFTKRYDEDQKIQQEFMLIFVKKYGLSDELMELLLAAAQNRESRQSS